MACACELRLQRGRSGAAVRRGEGGMKGRVKEGGSEGKRLEHNGALVQPAEICVGKSLEEAAPQCRRVVVLGQVELVAARLRRREGAAVVLRKDLDLEHGEPRRRQVRARSDEIEKEPALLVLHSLQLVEKELVDLRVLGVAAARVDVALQLRLAPLDAHRAAETRLQFGKRERSQRAQREDLLEPAAEGGRLRRHAVCQPQLCE
mmetsp:Transcript_31811/g.69613  ORF Transcript_31811/g.69613 Transcript_31811/m.69613 type:complete len:205 (-) Transcript_31811:319-933(-)